MEKDRINNRFLVALASFAMAVTSCSTEETVPTAGEIDVNPEAAHHTRNLVDKTLVSEWW